MDTVVFRPMEHEDLDQVLSIEAACFTTPWSRVSFENELSKSHGISTVAVSEGRVAGYLIVWMVADEIHIANIAVHSDWRRQGIGSRMIHQILDNTNGFKWIGLEVRRSNRVARALYKELDFVEVGVCKKYYVIEGEDAILMAKQLDQHQVVLPGVKGKEIVTT